MAYNTLSPLSISGEKYSQPLSQKRLPPLPHFPCVFILLFKRIRLEWTLPPAYQFFLIKEARLETSPFSHPIGFERERVDLKATLSRYMHSSGRRCQLGTDVAPLPIKEGITPGSNRRYSSPSTWLETTKKQKQRDAMLMFPSSFGETGRTRNYTLPLISLIRKIRTWFNTSSSVFFTFR